MSKLTRAFPRPHTEEMRMAGANNLIAIDCFNAAQSAGEPVTTTLVRRVVDELLTHRTGCDCGHCEAAAIARIGDACNIAASWQRIVAAVPRRAARSTYEHPHRTAS